MENCLCENCNSSLCNGKYICSENDYRVLDESDNLLKIIVEHDMDVIYSLAKKIYVLDSGDLIFDGTPNEVKNSKLVQERYIGIKQ